MKSGASPTTNKLGVAQTGTLLESEKIGCCSVGCVLSRFTVGHVGLFF